MDAAAGKHWLDPPDWWKKYRPLRWIAAAVIAYGVGSALWVTKELVLPSSKEHPDRLRFTAVNPYPVAMLAGFRSYMRLDDAAARLRAQGYETWSSASSNKPPSRHYPPRDLDTIRVRDYVHLRHSGELELEFFNDRLYEAVFRPKDDEMKPYLTQLRAQEPGLLRDRNGRYEKVTGAQRIASNLDLAQSKVGRYVGARPYALWQDLRLKSQLKEWDQKYSIKVGLPE